MLRLMLDAHPDLAVPGESHFIPPLWAARRRYRRGDRLDADRLLSELFRTLHFQMWKLPEEAVRRRVAELYRPGFADVIEAVFAAYAEQHGKPRWGDKTPIYVRHLPLLARLFPQARFVHLIRDGRDVSLSYLAVPWGPSTIWQSARKWRGDVTAGRRAGEALGPARYAEVRYEELIDDTRATVERVAAFVDLPFDERMLEHHVGWEDRIHAPETGRPFHASVARPLTPGLRNWREEMPDQQVRAFEAVAGDLLSELGYERRFPRVPVAERAAATARTSLIGLRTAGSRMKRAIVRRTLRRPPVPAWNGDRTLAQTPPA